MDLCDQLSSVTDMVCGGSLEEDPFITFQGSQVWLHCKNENKKYSSFISEKAMWSHAESYVIFKRVVL